MLEQGVSHDAPAPAGAPAPAPRRPDGLPAPQRYRAMAVILLGISMSVLDVSIVNLALPGIVRDLHANAPSAVWVVTAYQVATLVMLLPCAMLGDRIGHRRVYLAGLALFTVASLGCAFASSLAVLVAARTVQGLGSGGLMSVNSALVRATYPRHLLGRGIALNSLTVATASVAGPSIAALILSIASWPWLFAVNLPIGAVVLWLGRRALPRPREPRATIRLPVLDVALNVGMFALVFLGADALGANAAGTPTWLGTPASAALVLAGLGVGALYVHRQRREATPLLPLDLLRIPVFALSMCTSIAAFGAQTLAYVALPFLFLEALGRSHAQAGLLITAWPLATVLAAPVAGRLIGRVPDGLLGSIGLATMACGLAAMAMSPAQPANADIAWRLALCGVGFGLFQSPNNHTIVTSAPPARAGAGSGMLGTARLTGQTLGSVLLALIFALFGARSTHGPQIALGVAAGFAATAAVFSGLRLKAPAAAAQAA
jgi:DHA2 family multidrug resistance protein-like MFS transporter